MPAIKYNGEIVTSVSDACRAYNAVFVCLLEGWPIFCNIERSVYHIWDGYKDETELVDDAVIINVNGSVIVTGKWDELDATPDFVNGRAKRLRRYESTETLYPVSANPNHVWVESDNCYQPKDICVLTFDGFYERTEQARTLRDGRIASRHNTLRQSLNGEVTYLHFSEVVADLYPGVAIPSDRATRCVTNPEYANRDDTRPIYCESSQVVWIDGQPISPHNICTLHNGEQVPRWLCEYVESGDMNGYYLTSELDLTTCRCIGCNHRMPIREEQLCNRCNDGRRILDYSNRLAGKLKPERDVPIKFGIELEVGCDRDASESDCANFCDEMLNNSGRYVVLKYDGSLDDCDGFEIVTRPDCPSVHKRKWDKFLSDDRTRKMMSSFTNGLCGMHIHVSRAPLSKLQIGRVIVFVNEARNKELIRRIAGRYDNSYATIRDGVKFSDDSFGHYDAINLDNKETIEFRIFRGTLHREGFLKNIEFVEALLDYTSTAKRSLREMRDADAFVSFVARNRKQYENLNNKLKDYATSH